MLLINQLIGVKKKTYIRSRRRHWHRLAASKSLPKISSLIRCRPRWWMLVVVQWWWWWCHCRSAAVGVSAIEDLIDVVDDVEPLVTSHGQCNFKLRIFERYL
jgi:hypothetical protein